MTPRLAVFLALLLTGCAQAPSVPSVQSARPVVPSPFQQETQELLAYRPNLATAPALSTPEVSQNARELEGQVFVVLKNGNSVKMGLVKVLVYPAPYFKAFLSWQDENYERPIAKYQDAALRGNYDFRAGGMRAFNAWSALRDSKWSDLAPAPAQSVSDADGKFKLKVGFDGPFVVFASAQRTVGRSEEKYIWMVPSEKIAPNQPLFLSNDNLVAEDL